MWVATSAERAYVGLSRGRISNRIYATADQSWVDATGQARSHRACLAGHRVAFATATEWVDRLGAAHAAGRLQDELRRLGRTPLVIIDEVGYIPFDAEAANLFFQLILSRYERASVIMSSNKPFSRWGEVFGDPIVAAP